MASSKGNAYDVEILGYAPDGYDAKDYVSFRVRWREDGAERSARTRGYVTEMLHGIATGTVVDIIRDGRGSIIHIQKSDA